MSKEILIFIFFLILSGIFWFILTLNETYEREIKVTMQIKGIPKNVVLTSNEIDTLRVVVRDKGWMLISYTSYVLEFLLNKMILIQTKQK